MIRRKSNSGKFGIWIATIFCSIFIGIGATVLFSFYVLPCWALFRSGGWPQTQAVMDRIEVIESRGDDSTSYYPEAEYHYSIEGVPYSGSLFWFGQKNSVNQRALVDAAVEPFEVGGEFPLYYNPANPSESVVVRQLAPGSWFFAAFSVAFIIVPLLILWGAISSSSTKEKPSPLAVTSTDGFVGTASPVTSAFHSPTCPNEVDDPHNNQPYMVKPTSNQLTTAIALFCIAVVWLGITGIVGFANFRTFSFISGIFFTIFALAGIGMLAGAIYSYLGSLNPKPTVVCSQSQIYPGSEFEISWTFASNAGSVSSGSIRSIKLSLIGNETVTYRAGTDTRTELKAFIEQTLFESSDPTTFAEGFALTKIPADSMHTFQSTNNRVQWLVKMEGDIPYWPNISETFEIQVYPPPVSNPQANLFPSEVLS